MKPQLIEPFDGDRYIIVFEDSSMINNNEKCLVGDKNLLYEFCEEVLNKNGVFPYFIRPIHEKEKIPDEQQFRVDDVGCPYFHTINAYCKLLSKIKFTKELMGKIDIEYFIKDTIGREFCDCMSGGMDSFTVQVMRKLIQDYNVDESAEVYPNGYTVKDFMKETIDKEGQLLLPTPFSQLEII